MRKMSDNRSRSRILVDLFTRAVVLLLVLGKHKLQACFTFRLVGLVCKLMSAYMVPNMLAM